ncbi:MAG: DUF4136 domain-containing protein [Gammaproteobacteria bacterium]|nr:DUF4136 domain-containing protein [Gammaproteobacteria bacterium]
MKLQNIFGKMSVPVLAAMLVACATATNVDYRAGYDFSSIKSVQIAPPAQSESSDTRVNSPLVDERIRNAITDYLATRGIAVVDSNADASLAYQVGTRTDLEGSNSGFSIGMGTFGRHSAVGVGYGFPGYDVDSYDEFVLTIDILDVPDNAMLWRGSSTERLGESSTPETMTNIVNKLVSDILSSYPPGKK